MGTGDWNDGMNRVGREGRGESVWMAFFLHDVLRRFEPLCAARGDGARARALRRAPRGPRRRVEAHAWDGAWYRRAYFDDGTPLGTAKATECRIDVLPQAWAALSGAAPRERCEPALDAALRELVLPEGGLIRLLAPPFDRHEPSPGYIQGYVPGIRENGGQYTHAATWAVRACAELGWRERALPLLEMLLPVHHARTPEEVAVYQVEPYVVAADVYAVPPHVGRGGWTWYTGSSGWLLRVALESVLGLRMEDGARLAAAALRARRLARPTGSTTACRAAARATRSRCATPALQRARGARGARRRRARARGGRRGLAARPRRRASTAWRSSSARDSRGASRPRVAELDLARAARRGAPGADRRRARAAVDDHLARAAARRATRARSRPGGRQRAAEARADAVRALGADHEVERTEVGRQALARARPAPSAPTPRARPPPSTSNPPSSSSYASSRRTLRTKLDATQPWGRSPRKRGVRGSRVETSGHWRHAGGR